MTDSVLGATQSHNTHIIYIYREREGERKRERERQEETRASNHHSQLSVTIKISLTNAGEEGKTQSAYELHTLNLRP